MTRERNHGLPARTPALRGGLRVRRAAWALALTAALAPRAAHAQMLGLPVLQGGFVQPGLAAGVNAGGGSDFKTYGLAGAWGRGQGTLGISLGAGALTTNDRTFLTIGARVAKPFAFGASGALSIAPFVGAGGLRQENIALDSLAADPASAPKLTHSYINVPVGAGVGYRRVVAQRTVAVFATPSYQFWRLDVKDGESSTTGYFRVSLGADVALASRLGVTLGFETGATGDDGAAGGPNGSYFGAGASYAF